jgi:hypothetical protein
MVRSFRFQAISYVIYALAFTAMGVFELTRRTRDGFAYVQLVLAATSLLMVYVYWRRTRKYSAD